MLRGWSRTATLGVLQVYPFSLFSIKFACFACSDSNCCALTIALWCIASVFRRMMQGHVPDGHDPEVAGQFAKQLYEEVLQYTDAMSVQSSTLCNYADLLHAGGPGLKPDLDGAARLYERHFRHPDTKLTWITLDDCVWYVEVVDEAQREFFLRAIRTGQLRSRDDLIGDIGLGTVAVHSSTLPDQNGMFKEARRLLLEKFDLMI
jgi:hypothetical protein